MVQAPTKITDTKWNQLVARGRDLAAADRGETRFQLGDLALEAEAMGARGPKTGSGGRLLLYADEIGIAFETLRGYRTVAAEWPDGARAPSVAWTVHRALMGYPDRDELIRSREWTPTELRALRAERRPKVAPKRNERWWKAIQDELTALRKLDITKVPRRVSVAESKHRAKFIREQIELLERLAAVLEERGADRRI